MRFVSISLKIILILKVGRDLKGMADKKAAPDVLSIVQIVFTAVAVFMEI